MLKREEKKEKKEEKNKSNYFNFVNQFYEVIDQYYISFY